MLVHLASQTSLSLYWLAHPLFGVGYQFFSGIGSSISEWLVVTVALATYVYHHNCHEHGCLRLTWHPDKEGHPVCKVHHSDHPARGWFRRDKEHPRHRSAKKAARRASVSGAIATTSRKKE